MSVEFHRGMVTFADGMVWLGLGLGVGHLASELVKGDALARGTTRFIGPLGALAGGVIGRAAFDGETGLRAWCGTVLLAVAFAVAFLVAWFRADARSPVLEVETASAARRSMPLAAAGRVTWSRPVIRTHHAVARAPSRS